MSLEKEITFFYTDGNEKQTCRTIIDEAESRGYKTIQTSDIHCKAEIGFYCQHRCYPENSKFSIIMLHDMAQGHNRWPNFWHSEPWNKFDVGILPGSSWSERWKFCSVLPYAVPRNGVYVCGWPKADLIFKNTDTFMKCVDEFKKKLGLTYEKSVLYAPSWENDGKQNDVVQALMDLPVNILLKQAPYQSDAKNGWVSSFPQMVRDIEEMNKLHRGCAPNVHIIDPDLSIMYCIGMSDVLVSDESSVMLESLLLDVPSIAVMDWLVPDTIPPRFPIVPFDFAIKTFKKDLRKTVCDVLDNLDQHYDRLERARNAHFTNLGNASESIVDLIDSFVDNYKEKDNSDEQSYPDLLTFVQNTVALVESGKQNEALAVYEKYRKYYPVNDVLIRFDKLMENLKRTTTMRGSCSDAS